MKQLIIATLFILVGSAAYAAGTMMLLHVGSSGNGAVAPSSCDGSIDLSTGCVQPMLR